MHSTRITAIRHGETAWNVDTRIQGQLDVGLNDKGRWQAERAGAALAGDDIDAVCSSDLRRAFDTALSIAKPHGLRVQTDLGLRERGFGNFEGKTFAEIETAFPHEAMQWRKRVPEFAPEGGESLLVFRQRVLQCVASLCHANTDKHIVLVGHGGVMDVLYRAATGLDLQAPRSWELGNAAINRLLWNGEHLSLVGWADTAHFDAQHGAAMDEKTA